MAARIAAHRRERPPHWRVHEESVHLGAALREMTDQGQTAAGRSAQVVLVDCLTLWVANCLWPTASADTDLAGWRRERAEFLQAVSTHRGELIIVSNEVGTGIVPDNSGARLFRDEHGWLNQAVAAICDEVYFVTAGLPMCLKPCQTPPGHTTAPAR
jgi:adenosylcobinamide kinase/adenosylcobinamide-phosphate guanylyltransferase